MNRQQALKTLSENRNQLNRFSVKDLWLRKKKYRNWGLQLKKYYRKWAMKKVNELKKILQDQKPSLKADYGVVEIGLFGSYTKGNQKKTSDVDILVEFEKPIDLFTFVHLKNHLTELLGVNVDLVSKKALKPKIGERILRETVYI